MRTAEYLLDDTRPRTPEWVGREDAETVGRRDEKGTTDDDETSDETTFD